MDIAAMNQLDFIILSIIVVSAIISLFRGFVKEAFSLILWISAFFLTILFRPSAQKFLSNFSISVSLLEPLTYIIVFVSFIFFAESNGKYINKNLISDSYNFSYEIKNKNKSRVAEINYKKGLPVSVNADPPYRNEDIPTEEFLKKYGKGASDPNSAFVVSNKFNNPCLENSKSFDGIRSYKES